VKYGAKDIRFTTKGDTLYAFCLGAPTEDVRIASLGENATPLTGESCRAGFAFLSAGRVKLCETFADRLR
jgi:alpha-L-fucosidase